MRLKIVRFSARPGLIHAEQENESVRSIGNTSGQRMACRSIWSPFPRTPGTICGTEVRPCCFAGPRSVMCVGSLSSKGQCDSSTARERGGMSGMMVLGGLNVIARATRVGSPARFWMITVVRSAIGIF